jgi:hypothetical protein
MWRVIAPSMIAGPMAAILTITIWPSPMPLESAERQLINRILTGLRYSYEEAGGIIEDLDFVLQGPHS